MTPPIRVLFICTGNACRSQMSEAILRKMGGDRFDARSAGSRPAGYVHPVAIETMKRMDISLEGQRSKSWDEFADDENHIIITVCDSAAKDGCPNWPGHPATAHWPLPDPSFVPGEDEDRFSAGMDVAHLIQKRLAKLIALPLETMPPAEAKTAVQAIVDH